MGGTTHQVRVWQIKHVQGRRRPYGVRWITAGREHSEWYATKSLAEAFWAQLVRAQKAGEGFEVSSGLPLTLMRQRGERTLLELAVAYVDWLWKRSPANTRKAALRAWPQSCRCSAGHLIIRRSWPASNGCSRLACCRHLDVRST